MLVTGDRVTYSVLADGRRTYTVQAAPRPDGRPVRFSAASAGDDYYVIPSDAGDRLAAGTLDRQLFNVSLLVRDGQATADRPASVIVGYEQGLGVAAATALPGARAVPPLWPA